MRIQLLLDGDPEAHRIAEALAVRGHRASQLDPQQLDGGGELAAADLVIAAAELAAQRDLVEKVASLSPGTEFVLVGPRGTINHPDVIEHLERPIDLQRLLAVVDDLADVLDGERLREPVDLVAYETLFAGDSPQTRELLRRVRLVARSEAPVWIFGDDGSGRAIIARAIHDRSARRREPFVALNCAVYGDEELSRRLFHGDGAAIQTARTGSLFIERVAVSGPATQRALAQYLEQRDPTTTSTRLIIGTQREIVADGARAFVSSDLFYRLKVLEIDIPPLKDRVRDLEQIVGRMLGRLASDGEQPRLTAEAMHLLERYAFPGNLLELAHALTHAYVLARGEAIEARHLPISIRAAASDPGPAADTDGDLEALEVVAKRFEREYLLRVLRSVGGNRGRAAEILGLSRKGLWGKLKSHGISDDVIDGDDELP